MTSPAGGVWDGWYDGESFLVGWRGDDDAVARAMFEVPDDRLVRVFVALLREINPKPARKRDATDKQAVPDDLVEVAARAVQAHRVAGTGANRRGVTLSGEEIARLVLEAVYEAGWVRADDIDGLRDVPNQSWQAMHQHLAEARAQVERLRAEHHHLNRDERRRATEKAAEGLGHVLSKPSRRYPEDF